MVIMVLLTIATERNLGIKSILVNMTGKLCFNHLISFYDKVTMVEEEKEMDFSKIFDNA